MSTKPGSSSLEEHLDRLGELECVNLILALTTLTLLIRSGALSKDAVACCVRACVKEHAPRTSGVDALLASLLASLDRVPEPSARGHFAVIQGGRDG